MQAAELLMCITSTQIYDGDNQEKYPVMELGGTTLVQGHGYPGVVIIENKTRRIGPQTMKNYFSGHLSHKLRELQEEINGCSRDFV